MLGRNMAPSGSTVNTAVGQGLTMTTVYTTSVVAAMQVVVLAADVVTLKVVPPGPIGDPSVEETITYSLLFRKVNRPAGGANPPGSDTMTGASALSMQQLLSAVQGPDILTVSASPIL